MEFIALSAPVFLIFLVSLSIASLFLRKYRVAVTSVALCLAVNWLFSIFPVVGAFQNSGDSNGLKVLTFNCNLHYTEQDYLSDIAKVQKLLITTDADVVFLTENYFHDYDTLWRSDVMSILIEFTTPVLLGTAFIANTT